MNLLIVYDGTIKKIFLYFAVVISFYSMTLGKLCESKIKTQKGMIYLHRNR